MIAGNNLRANWQSKAIEMGPKDLGTTLVIAPHPDDESLGCGGTIALLRKLDIQVHLLFVSDGSMSHPNSKKYFTERLILQREAEALDALQILGVGNDAHTFLRLKDTQVPTLGSEGFAAAVTDVAAAINKIKPQTILVPWQKDPHVDHRASWQLVDAAITRLGFNPRLLQYFIWLWELGKQEDLPTDKNVDWYKVNIETVFNVKQQAIAAHLSQTTGLIDDDEEGFTLSLQVLEHFKTPFELFAETV